MKKMFKKSATVPKPPPAPPPPPPASPPLQITMQRTNFGPAELSIGRKSLTQHKGGIHQRQLSFSDSDFENADFLNDSDDELQRQMTYSHTSLALSENSVVSPNDFQQHQVQGGIHQRQLLFSDADIENADFDNGDIHQRQLLFSDADIENADFENADFLNAPHQKKSNTGVTSYLEMSSAYNTGGNLVSIKPADLLASKKKLKHTKPKEPVHLDRANIFDKFGFNDHLCMYLVIDNLVSKITDWSEIRSLNLSGVEQVTDMFFLVLKVQQVELPGLQTLTLTGCHHITDQGIKWLSEIPDFSLTEIVMKGCKHLTHRNIYRLFERKNAPNFIDLASTSTGFFPSQFPPKYLGQVNMKGCALISPPMDTYIKRPNNALLDVRMESFHIYKLLVLHDPDSNQRTGIFTKKALDADHVITIQKEWPLPGDDPQKQYRYNVFEFLTGKGCEDMVISNGCIIVLPFSDTEDVTAKKLATHIITILGQYPENVFVLAAMKADDDNTLTVMCDKVKGILKGWSNYLASARTYRGQEDKWVLTEHNFDDQIQMGYSQALLDNLNLYLTNQGLISSVNMAKDTKHSYLKSTTDLLGVVFPWHQVDFTQLTVRALNIIIKTGANMPLVSALSDVKNACPVDTRFNFNPRSGYSEIGTVMQVLHDKGATLYFPQINRNPAIPNIDACVKLVGLGGKAPHHADIRGVGLDVPCWRKDDFKLLNKDLSEVQINLFVDILLEQGLLFRFPCSLKDPKFTDTIIYVSTQDLPDSPDIPVDDIWPPDLPSGDQQRDAYFTFPSLPNWLLPCFLRKLQETSQIVLMWKSGLVLRQGPVLVLVELLTNEMCQDLPTLVISARVKNAGLFETLFIAFNNIKTILAAMMQTRKVFGAKTVGCKMCNPTKNRRHVVSLSQNCCYVKEMDVKASETSVLCKKTKDVVMTKQEFIGSDLTRREHIPNHADMAVLTPDDDGRMSTSARCYLCNNCSLKGMSCHRNLRNGISSKHCSCNSDLHLCSYCGVCRSCLQTLSNSHSTVQPCFTPNEEELPASIKRIGTTLSFSMEGTEYTFPDSLNIMHFNHLSICLNRGCHFTFRIASPSSTLVYDTGEGKFFVNDEEKGGQKSDKPKDCKMSDCLDFELSLEDSKKGLDQVLRVRLNSEVIFWIEHPDKESKVSVMPNKPGNILIYTPHFMRMEEIDTTNADNYQDGGKVLKCCGPFPTVIERKLSIMYPTLEDILFKNHMVDFTGAAGVMLPETMTWNNVLYPSFEVLKGTQVYHPLCLTRSNTGMEIEDSHDEWLRKNLVHLVNAGGYMLEAETARLAHQLILGWHCLLMHYPQLDLPPYDRLLPEVASAPNEKYTSKQIGDGVQEILRITAINMASTVEDLGRAAFKNRAGLDEASLEIQLTVENNETTSGLFRTESSMVPGRILFICPGHIAGWQIGVDLAEVPIDLFKGYSNFITSIKLVNNRLTYIPPDAFLNLPHLLKIDLSGNFLDSLPDTVGLCKSLHYVDVPENNLLDLPASLVNCERLCRIDISQNSMEVLPPVIIKLKGLRRLIANDLMLMNLPENMGDMASLEVMYMNGTCLTTLPKSFAKLQKLRELSLAGVMWLKNKANLFHTRAYFEKFLDGRGIKRWMEALPEKVNEDEMFQLFDIDSNGTLDTKETARVNASLFTIFPRFGYKGKEPPDDNTPSGFPEEIFALKNLVYLNLQYQGIVHVPEGIQNLEKLDSITLAFNPNLLSIAAEAGRCPLKRLTLDDCPLLKTPPKEIRERGFKTTFAYLKRLLTGSVDCKRTKLMLVGLGGAGKTSLVKSLMSSAQNESSLTGADAITDGIDICTWNVDHNGEVISYSVWDFAGQTIYYNTHQFFLSDRAVYLLLWNIRLGHEHAGLYFWLNSITVHAPKAPIFIVGTHTDQMTKIELPIDEMRQSYHQIEGFHFVSSKNGNGIPDLKNALFRVTLQQEYMGEKIPQAWLQLESIINKEKVENHIDVMQYKDVESRAAEAGIVDAVEVAQAIQFLHDLGSVQHFQNEYLQAHVVINPQWIVDVMACVVSVKQSCIQDGRLKHSDIGTVWKDYPKMAEWLLRLTEEFDLTYQLEGEKCNIVPCLLPEKRPTFEWPEMNKNEGIFETTMIYRFDYLPAGLFNRGQVRLHGYSEDSVIWKRGSFLKKSGQLALIQQIKDSELNVKVQGMRPDNMLFFVHEVFEGLIIESFHGVTYDYEIPCPDCTKQYVKDPHMFKASGIRRALELKAPFLQCQKYFHTAPVLDLQGILAPDTNSDYEVHLDQDVNNLQHMQSEMSVDLFILYCIKDAPTNRSKVIHPADVCSDLEKEGYTCYMPEGKELISREEMAKRLVHASVILVFMSNNYAASDICCDMFKYTVNTMKKPTFVVAVGENFDWQQSPSLGVFMSDVVFVNMINSKKAVYNTKFAELLSTLQKNEQLNLSKPETSNACFVSYSWVNSHAAVECGTRELPGAIGNGDPRELKKYLEDNGIGCWIDVEQVNVNDQLFSRIAKGMSEARIMLACVSDEYVQSKNCCKELRFAIQLGLPLVIAVVGTGDHWKRSEVGFHSLSYPTVDFQRINSNASEDLLKLVKTHILAEHQEDAEERKRKKDWANEEKNNRSFQEMYELAQRKFLRQISSYASAQDIGNYPRLFVVDIVAKPASDKVSGEESSADSFKSRRYSVSTLCECEQGWHSVSDPIMLKDNFATVLLEEYASYLARITMLLQHSLNFVLGLYGDVDGQNYLKRIQEMALKSSNDFQTCYHKLRQVVSELDSRGGKGKLHRCRLPSGKTIWLCEAHSTKMKVTVLSDKVTEVKHKVTNQPWLDAMVDCLRMDQKHPFHFKSTMKGKRVPEALKVDDVERDMRRTMSRSASTLNKSALHKATMKEVLREIKMEESSQSTEKTAKKTSVKGKVEFKEAPTVIDGERNVDTVMKGKGTSEEVKRETKDQEVVENANNSQQDVNSIGASHSTETPKPEENTTTPQTNQNTPTPQAGENGPQSKETTPTPQATANSPAHNSIQNTPTTGPKAKDTTPVSSPKKVQPTTQPSNTVKQQPQAESKACILL